MLWEFTAANLRPEDMVVLRPLQPDVQFKGQVDVRVKFSRDVSGRLIQGQVHPEKRKLVQFKIFDLFQKFFLQVLFAHQLQESLLEIDGAGHQLIGHESFSAEGLHPFGFPIFNQDLGDMMKS